MKKYTLKQLREKNGYTQEQVANLTNNTITFISLLENGKRNASDSTKRKLAELYNCDVTKIFLALELTKSENKEKELIIS